MSNIKRIAIISSPEHSAFIMALVHMFSETQKDMTVVIAMPSDSGALPDLENLPRPEPIVMEIKPYDIEPLDDASILTQQIEKTEADFQKRHKKQMQFRHNHNARNALKYNKKPSAFLARKY